jgi:poly(beta-D-mannuronate) lyase
MKFLGILVLSLAFILPAAAQHVNDPRASLIDVAARQAKLKSTNDPLLRQAIKSLKSCEKLPFIPPPTGHMKIPPHYFSGGNGPINPAAEETARPYVKFEIRINAGMNQYVATGSHKESACALAQLDAWAQAHALLDYDRDEPTPQAWFQVTWSLGAAGIAESVLMNDSTLDPVVQQRVIAWLDTAALKDISFERPGDPSNNHHFYRGLTATSIGVIASDDKLFQFGVRTYKDGIGVIDPNGALPKEMARHENAIHYDGFALQALVLIAQFASRQGIDLYTYEDHGRSLRDAVIFFGRIVDDPSLIRPYSNDAQTPIGSGSFAPFAFYVARFGTEGLPPAIVNALKGPTTSTRGGGCSTVLVSN